MTFDAKRMAEQKAAREARDAARPAPAAKLERPVRGKTTRELVYDALVTFGEATREEIAMLLDMSPGTVDGRCSELLNDGRIRETGETRPTQYGGSAKVLAA